MAEQGISRDEFHQWMETLRDGISGVHDRLDGLNGRTRTAEADIAVLKDRSNRLERQQQEQARQSSVMGLGGGGLVVGLYEVGRFVWSMVNKP